MDCFAALAMTARAGLNSRASLRGKHKDLAGIDQVGIADLPPVRLVDDGVAHAGAVRGLAETPEAIAARDRGGRDFWYHHGGGRRTPVRQDGSPRGRQLRSS